jgi:hypothetical protein
VTLTDGSGALLGTAYLYGTGQAPLLGYNPSTQTVLYTGLNAPQAMAVDAASNIFIADTGNARVIEIPWNGTGYGTPVNVGTGFSAPSGVAVDGAGNVYVADASLNQIIEVPWTGSSYGTQYALLGAYTFAQDVAIDGSGDLFILAGTSVTELPWNGTGYGTPVSIGTGLSNGQYSTEFVDSSANLYIADYMNGNIVKETLSGGNYTQTILGNFGAQSVDGVATDPAGDVYIANYEAGSVLMLPWTGSGYGTQITLTSNGSLSGPGAIYLDGIGNIYIEDFNNNLLEQWSVSTPPTLDFNTATDVGSTDAADGAQTVSLLNAGNALLTISVPAAGTDPSIASGFSYDAASTCPQLSPASAPATLNAAASCTYAVDFVPTEPGVNSGAMVLTDNYLGAVSAIETIGLIGMGISEVAKLAFQTTPASPIDLTQNAGRAVTVAEEKSNSAVDTYANDVITLTVTGPNSYAQMYTATAVSGLATFNLSGAALIAAGSYTYIASLSGVTSAIASETVNNTSPQIISFAPSSPITYGISPLTLVATGGTSGNPVTFSILSGGGAGALSGPNNNVLTVTGAGTIVIAANQAGNGSYSAAPQATASIVVNKAAQSIGFAPASPMTYGVSPITLAATGGGSGNAVTFSIISGAGYGALSGVNNNVLTITGTGTITIAADQAGNNNYFAATQVTSSIVVEKAAQSIDFDPASPVTYGTSPITLTATGGASGNPITFSILSGGSFGVLSGVNNSLLTVSGAGTIVIAADQAANGDYEAAAQATASIVVSKAPQTIGFTAASPVIYGVSPITLTASGGASGTPVTFSILSGGASGTLSGVNNSVLTVTGAGAIVIAANQAANIDYAAAPQVTAGITVNKAAQTIGFTPASPVAYGATPITLTATGGDSASPVTFSIVSGGAFGTLSGSNNSLLTVAGAGTIVIEANQAGSGNYLAAAPVTASIMVAKAPQTISFTSASPVTYGVAPITLSAMGGGSGYPVTFTVLSGPGTLSGSNSSTLTVTGAGTIVIAANQAGSNNYLAATEVTTSIAVNKAVQAITFTSPSQLTYGVAPITLTATGGASGNAVGFTCASGPCSLSGINNSTLTVTGAGTIVIAANQPGATNYSPALPVTANIVIEKSALVAQAHPASSVYGTAFPTFTGSLTGVVAGDGITASYSTAATPTSTAGGSYSITDTLNDPESRLGNYLVTITPATLTITQAALSVTANSASSVYGAVFPAFTGSLAGVVAGDGITATYSTTATPASPIGSNYQITASLNDPNNKLGNYTISNTPGMLSITRSAITVVVNSATSIYGAPFPAFTGSLTGVVPGDGITASYSTTAVPTSPPGGSYGITATLIDPNNKLANYGVTITPGQLTITKAASAITLLSGTNPALLSTSIPLTVTVLSPAGMPTGTVNFLDSATLLGSAPLLNGTASLGVSTLTAGSHMLIATYSGDANFAGAASDALTQAVVEITASAGEGGGSSSNNTSQTVSAGGSATFSLSILPINGISFPTATVLTLTGMPAGATTTVSPTTWTQTSSTLWTLPANSPLSNVSITIQLPAGTAHVDAGPGQGRTLPLLWALLLAPCLRRMRRKFKWQMQTALLLLLAAGCAAATAISACGSSGQAVVTPPQSYTINETLSAGTQSYDATLTLTVE